MDGSMMPNAPAPGPGGTPMAAEPVEPQGDDDGRQESITQPAKLLRIASMVRELLEDTRQASLDEPGRARLREIYERSINELSDVLSPDLREELESLAPPMNDVPTESEIRIAQAQLVGWLEGLFHGIQAALFAQQAAARAQFEELRRRGLPAGAEPGQPQGPDARGAGQYL